MKPAPAGTAWPKCTVYKSVWLDGSSRQSGRVTRVVTAHVGYTPAAINLVLEANGLQSAWVNNGSEYELWMYRENGIAEVAKD